MLYRILLCSALATGAIPAQEAFTGVWRAGNDGYALLSGLEWPQFEAKWKEYAGKNLRLTDVETFVRGNKRRFIGVWRAGSGAHYLWAGVDWDSFNAKWKELAGKNLRLIDIETYVDGGQRKYLGVWRAGSDGHYLWAGVDWDSFNAKWKELAGKNLRLVDVETYVDRGQRKYIGVWRAGSDAHYLWAGVDWDSFIAKRKELTGKNLRLADMEMYDTSQGRRYIGVWRAGNDAHYLWANVDWENFTTKWSDLAAGNLRLEDIETCEGCDAACANQISGGRSYERKVDATNLHCADASKPCPTPGSGAFVGYRRPVDPFNKATDGKEKPRLDIVYHDDALFTLPFTDTDVKLGSGYVYDSGSHHYALDYSKGGTFQVKAAAPGRVVYMGWNNNSGNTVVVSHDVGGKKDAWRTVYMHLRNGPATDCAAAWAISVPWLSGDSRSDYITHLNESGCPQNVGSRKPDPDHWGTNSHRLDMTLLGKTVQRGDMLGWAGNTGPGGKSGSGGPNTHLHIKFARRDDADGWYLVDPFGIYAASKCYPDSVTGTPRGPCARYPVAWQGGHPQYPSETRMRVAPRRVAPAPQRTKPAPQRTAPAPRRQP